jgi:hypothetical protein
MNKIHNNNLGMFINRLKGNWNKVEKDKFRAIQLIRMIKWVKVQAFQNFLWTQKGKMEKFQELGGDKFDICFFKFITMYNNI